VFEFLAPPADLRFRVWDFGPSSGFKV
jgi:hypothetical protein